MGILFRAGNLQPQAAGKGAHLGEAECHRKAEKNADEKAEDGIALFLPVQAGVFPA